MGALLARASRAGAPSAMNWYQHRPLDRALRHLEPCLIPGARVLDLGCGNGWLLQQLATLGTDAVGIDIDKRGLRAVRGAAPPGRTRAHWIAADAARLPFADQSFDAVVSISVLQYTDWRRTLAECGRVLRKGGRAVFVENLFGHPLARLYRAARRAFWPYQPNLVPRQHIAWRELGAFSEVFGAVEVRAHALLTPALALSDVASALPGRRAQALEAGPYREGRVGGGPGRTRRLAFEVLEAVDDVILRSGGRAAQLAWLATVTCINGGPAA